MLGRLHHKRGVTGTTKVQRIGSLHKLLSNIDHFSLTPSRRRTHFPLFARCWPADCKKDGSFCEHAHRGKER